MTLIFARKVITWGQAELWLDGVGHTSEMMMMMMMMNNRKYIKTSTNLLVCHQKSSNQSGSDWKLVKQTKGQSCIISYYCMIVCIYECMSARLQILSHFRRFTMWSCWWSSWWARTRRWTQTTPSTCPKRCSSLSPSLDTLSLVSWWERGRLQGAPESFTFKVMLVSFPK